MSAKSRGFTIVELLIVIVVIAILAAISIVAYNGIQQRARDAKRKQDVSQIVKLLQIYAGSGSPMYTGSGCGFAGSGSGWFNYSDGTPGGYPKSMMQCLIDANITSGTIKDDSLSCSGASCRAYMKYSCLESGQLTTYVYANLEGGTHSGTETDTTCTNTVDSGQGMNYFVRFTE